MPAQAQALGCEMIIVGAIRAYNLQAGTVHMQIALTQSKLTCCILSMLRPVQQHDTAISKVRNSHAFSAVCHYSGLA